MRIASRHRMVVRDGKAVHSIDQTPCRCQIETTPFEFALTSVATDTYSILAHRMRAQATNLNQSTGLTESDTKSIPAVKSCDGWCNAWLNNDTLRFGSELA